MPNFEAGDLIFATARATKKYKQTCGSGWLGVVLSVAEGELEVVSLRNSLGMVYPYDSEIAWFDKSQTEGYAVKSKYFGIQQKYFVHKAFLRLDQSGEKISEYIMADLLVALNKGGLGTPPKAKRQPATDPQPTDGLPIQQDLTPTQEQIDRAWEMIKRGS